MHDPARWTTVVSLAEILGMSPDYLAQYCRRNRILLEKVRTANGRWLNAISVEDAEEITDSRSSFRDDPAVRFAGQPDADEPPVAEPPSPDTAQERPQARWWR